jgi:hypothetical protein
MISLRADLIVSIELPKAPETTAKSTHVISSSTPTTHSTSTNTATRAPGTETGAVGGRDQTTANSEPHKSVKEEFAAVGHGTLNKPSSSAAAREAPKTESSAVAGQGKGPMPGQTGADYQPSSHARTGSASSGGSKRSFLDKVSLCIGKKGMDADVLRLDQGQDPQGQALDAIDGERLCGKCI